MDTTLISEDSSKFNPIIIKNKNGFCIFLPEWKISGAGATLEDAYFEYNQSLKEKEDSFNKFGLATLSAEPYPNLKNADIRRDLILFLSKVALSTIIIIAVFIALLPIMRAALRDALTQSTQALISAESRDPRYWALKFPTDINAKLNRMSPEDREKMLKEWNELLTQTSPLWKPLKCN
jgi:hypothetical protein